MDFRAKFYELPEQPSYKFDLDIESMHTFRNIKFWRRVFVINYASPCDAICQQMTPIDNLSILAADYNWKHWGQSINRP